MFLRIVHRSGSGLSASHHVEFGYSNPLSAIEWHSFGEPCAQGESSQSVHFYSFSMYSFIQFTKQVMHCSPVLQNAIHSSKKLELFVNIFDN